MDMSKRLGSNRRSMFWAILLVLLAVCCCSTFAGVAAFLSRNWLKHPPQEGITTSTLPLRLRWTYQVDEDVIFSPPWYRDGIVFVEATKYLHPVVIMLQSTPDSWLYALDGETGEQRWTFSTFNMGTRTSDIDSGLVNGGSVVAFTHSSHEVTVLDTWDGFVRWQLGSAVRYSLLADDRTLYVVTEEHVLAYDLEKGVKLWENEESFPARTISGPIRDGDRLYVPGLNRTWVLDPVTGRTEGILDVDLYYGFTIISEGRIFTQERHYKDSDWLVAYDAETGKQLWRKPYDPWCPYWQATIVGDILLFRTQAGSLLAVDTNTGESVWEYLLSGEAEVISNVAFLDGLVYFLVSDKTLRAVELSTGK